MLEQPWKWAVSLRFEVSEFTWTVSHKNGQQSLTFVLFLRLHWFIFFSSKSAFPVNLMKVESNTVRFSFCFMKSGSHWIVSLFTWRNTGNWGSSGKLPCRTPCRIAQLETDADLGEVAANATPLLNPHIQCIYIVYVCIYWYIQAVVRLTLEHLKMLTGEVSAVYLVSNNKLIRYIK